MNRKPSKPSRSQQLQRKELRIGSVSGRTLLSRILNEPAFIRSVRRLPPPTLHHLILHVGLEDAGELVALATSEQLASLFDEDLWRVERPALDADETEAETADEVFDAERFLLWLEILLESGERFVAERLSSLPEDLVILGFHRHVLVLNMDELLEEWSAYEDAEQVDKALEGCLYQEFDEYRVIARRADGWDAVLGVLSALDSYGRDLFVRILERCAALSSRFIEDHGGLCNALTDAEMLESDAAGDREERRATHGYVSRADARAFMRLALASSFDELLASSAPDAITRAYFRRLERSAPSVRVRPNGALPMSPEKSSEAVNEARLLTLLAQAGVTERGSDIPLLPDASPSTPLKGALRALSGTDPVLYAERLEELAYLANVVLTHESAEALRPVDAADRVMDLCTLGIRAIQGTRASGGTEVDIVREVRLTKLFLLGAHQSAKNPCQGSSGP